ncbi:MULTISPECIES: hypothetical protein [unclassified Nocardia]|uniref:hypothetical protein n=1 Tax=unclassified Nocardia TaxID=2637762 RepID=UPI001CE43A46|nr:MULTISPECIES: hypothetical protein [unclassified Nocardia]
MRPYTLPEIVEPKDLESLLNIGRSMLARLRTDDPEFPEPVPALSRPRRPRWWREQILRWLVKRGRAPEAALPAFEVIDPSGPVAQRWQRTDWRFADLPTARGTTKVHVTRYLPLDDADPRVVSLCVPVDDPGYPALDGRNLTPALLATLGYRDGQRGAVAWIQPHDWSQYDHGDLFGAELPDDPSLSVRTELLDGAIVAQLLGHPLPYWERGAVSAADAAAWAPGRAPAFDASPPGLRGARQLRLQCREVIDQIALGQRPAPAEIADELAQLGNTMWDTVLGEFNWQYKPDPTPLAGWVMPINPPRTSLVESAPLLPHQPGHVDLYHALEWLIDQPDLPEGMAAAATGYYGYPNSIDVLTLDLTGLPVPLRAAIDRNLVPIEARPTWLHKALTPAPDEETGTPMGWKADPDRQAHPALTTGDLLRYHVPRAAFPLGTPAGVHLIAQGPADQRHLAGFLVDRLGELSPLPLNPAPHSAEATAAELAAIALGITEPLHLGHRPKLWNAPTVLIQLATGLASTDHLELDWAALRQIVGPRPDDTDDRALVHSINDRKHHWPNE